MKQGQDKKELDNTTEQKILNAARKVFLHKGYAASRTRDIADEAGINLALLNYYFRSKHKLFEIVMLENLQQMIGGLRPVINDESLTLKKKVEAVAGNYIDLLLGNPDLPLFVLSEIKSHPESFADKIDAKHVIRESHLFRQMQHLAPPGTDPWQILLNLMSLSIFPFVGKPLMQIVGAMESHEYRMLMEERKRLIPEWIMSMLNIKINQ
jgi:AcrR family transcriptional regulator